MFSKAHTICFTTAARIKQKNLIKYEKTFLLKPSLLRIYRRRAAPKGERENRWWAAAAFGGQLAGAEHQWSYNSNSKEKWTNLGEPVSQSRPFSSRRTEVWKVGCQCEEKVCCEALIRSQTWDLRKLFMQKVFWEVYRKRKLHTKPSRCQTAKP